VLLLLLPLLILLLFAAAPRPAAAFSILPAPPRRRPTASPLLLKATTTSTTPSPTSTGEDNGSSSSSSSGSSSIGSPPTPSAQQHSAAAASLRVRRATRADLRRVATMQVMEYGGQGLAFLWHYLQVRACACAKFWAVFRVRWGSGRRVLGVGVCCLLSMPRHYSLHPPLIPKITHPPPSHTHTTTNQELDRLQTSFWVDPTKHAMLVVEDTSATTTSTSSTPSTSTVPFGALGALLLGDPSVVGFVDLDARDRRVDRSTPDPYLSDLIIDPARRGQGLGRLLMAEAEGVAAGWGFPAVYLKVRESNTRGLALYASLGYAVVVDAGQEGIFTMRKWLPLLGWEGAEAAAAAAREELEEREKELLAAAASIMTPFFFDPRWSGGVSSSNSGSVGDGDGEAGGALKAMPSQQQRQRGEEGEEEE
jgi:ribosomal protein S18 acetylase RimI-like enzyme